MLSTDYIQENMVFQRIKTIDVHCRGAKMYFPIFSHMLFWEASVIFPEARLINAECFSLCPYFLFNTLHYISTKYIS
jgi:hypothetical protein